MSRFKLYYWPTFPGRGELIRLVFAETATPFDDVFRDRSFQDAIAFCSANKRFFAVPAIEDCDNDNLLLSQTCVIMRYLAERCDGGRLYPAGNNGYKAEVLMQDAADALAEGCNAWHAIDHNKGYTEQAVETRPYIDVFVSKRLPKWLSRFNTVLEENYTDSRGPETPLYFVVDSLSYADLAIFHVNCKLACLLFPRIVVAFIFTLFVCCCVRCSTVFAQRQAAQTEFVLQLTMSSLKTNL